MARVETVKIKSDAHPSGYIIVNKDQAHKYESKPKAEEKPKAEYKPKSMSKRKSSSE